MGEIKIDKGIKIPPHIPKGNATCKYPWKQMNVGDSFLADIPKSNIHSLCSRAGRTYNRKFSVRKMEGGYRIWRVK